MGARAKILAQAEFGGGRAKDMPATSIRISCIEWKRWRIKQLRFTSHRERAAM